MSVHQEAERLGVPRPELEHYEYQDGATVVVALTPESDRAWSEYLRNITMAKLALRSEGQLDTISVR